MARSFLDWAFEGRSDKWLYVVGMLLLIAFLHYSGAPMSKLLGLAADSSQWPMAVAYVYNRLPLIVYLISVPLWVHFVHKRPWWSVVSQRPQIEWWNLGVGALLALIALIVTRGVYVTFFGTTIKVGTPDLATFLPALAFGFFFVFMQTTTEELVFRGYGMQAVRRFTASPVALVVITALLFALVHYDNVMTIGWPWWGLLNYALPALLFGYMVLRTGSVWMPIGWHWLNNLILTRIYIQENDVASGRDVLAYEVGRPSLGAELATYFILFLIIAVIVDYLVSRREAARGDSDRQPVT